MVAFVLKSVYSVLLYYSTNERLLRKCVCQYKSLMYDAQKCFLRSQNTCNNFKYNFCYTD